MRCSICLFAAEAPVPPQPRQCHQLCALALTDSLTAAPAVPPTLLSSSASSSPSLLSSPRSPRQCAFAWHGLWPCRRSQTVTVVLLYNRSMYSMYRMHRPWHHQAGWQVKRPCAAAGMSRLTKHLTSSSSRRAIWKPGLGAVQSGVGTGGAILMRME